MLRSKLLVLFSMLLMLGWAAAQQNEDRHLTTDPARQLFVRSAYAHGYIHGYEEGFRQGDLNIHLDRSVRPVHDYKQFRDPPGYHSKFGDRDYFRTGYRQGFRAGYEDANKGGLFRAESLLRSVASGLDRSPDTGKEFDQAMSSGYESGRKQGTVDAEPQPDFQATSERCLARRNSPAYCDVFARGFYLGYSDAFVGQQYRQMQAKTGEPAN